MRTAAAVIGGTGAALGALLYPPTIVLWVVIRVLSGLPLSPSPVDLAFVGPLAAATLCCAAGAAGAWLVFAGGGRGALLMLLAALGVAAFVAAQPFLVDAAGDHGLPERFRDDIEPSLAGSAAQFFPALVLLVGTALAYLAPNRVDG